jgi:predicted nuclease of predicted toxin-antitoxin system
VKFLVDNQLPDALCRFLNARGHESGHVLDLHMDEASDLEIWNYAATGNWIVVSKDEDFLHLANREGDTGKLLWVRIGNSRK